MGLILKCCNSAIMQVKSMDYDCIIFDTAPTGHTLRLLQFPTMLEKGLSKLMALRGSIGGALSQVGALLGADLETMQAQLVGRLEELKASLCLAQTSLAQTIKLALHQDRLCVQHCLLLCAPRCTGCS